METSEPDTSDIDIDGETLKVLNDNGISYEDFSNSLFPIIEFSIYKNGSIG